MQLRRCAKCVQEKTVEDFYAYPGKPGRLLCYCKECIKAQSKARRDSQVLSEKQKDRVRERKRMYYKNNPKRVSSKVNYSKKYPEKYKARLLWRKIPSIKGMINHHWSYLEENILDVIVVTVDDHYKLHRFISYVQLNMCYKVIESGLLLDTKEKHLEFLNKLLYAA